MAESASNDFTVSVAVDGDWQRFRATAQREIAEFQKTGISLPVGGGGIPGASGAVPSTSVAAAAQNAVQMALAPVNAFPGNPGGALATSGHAFGGVFGGGFGGAPPGIINIPNAVGGQGPASALAMMHWGGVTPSGGVMGPDGSVYDERTYWSNQMWEEQIGQLAGGPVVAAAKDKEKPKPSGRRGSMGPLTGTYLAYAASRVALAYVDHERDLREAGSDPERIARADTAYQRKWATGIPIAGEFGYALREYVTHDNEDVERTLNSAKEQDQRTASMRQTAELHSHYSAARQLAGSFGGVERARITGEMEYSKSLIGLRDAQMQQEASVRSGFDRQRADLEKQIDVEWAEQRKRYIGSSRSNVEELHTAEYKQIRDEEAAALKKVRAPFDQDRDAAATIRDRQNLDAERARNAAGYTAHGETTASYFRTRNQPFAASLSERMTRMGLDIFNAEPENRAAVAQQGMQGMAEEAVQFGRQFGSQQRALAAEQAVMSRILARDPLGASIARITGARDQALQEAQSLPWGFRQIRQGAIRAAAGLQEQVERQDYNDRTGMRTRALQADVDITGLEAGGQEKTAHAESIKRRAEMAAEASRIAGEPAGNQRLIMQAALNEERTYLRELKKRGDQGSAQEVYPGMFGPGATSGDQQEPVVDAVKSVERAIQDLKAALTGAN